MGSGAANAAVQVREAKAEEQILHEQDLGQHGAQLQGSQSAGETIRSAQKEGPIQIGEEPAKLSADGRK